MLSYEDLLREAASAGFHPDPMEKALRLLELLESLRIHPFLKERIVLKGGSALKLESSERPGAQGEETVRGGKKIGDRQENWCLSPIFRRQAPNEITGDVCRLNARLRQPAVTRRLSDIDRRSDR
ncbi:MAG: hypothetical protein WBC70_11420 [Candidatus Aminicenantales bacterium]